MESVIENKKIKFFTYDELLELIENLSSQGIVTGNNQSEDYLQTTQMNLHRIKRIQKKAALTDSLLTELKAIKRKQIWYVFVEGWCADASQNIPYLNLMANFSDNIELKFLLRDENEEIMNNYLTNGAMAIPKLVSFDAKTNSEIGVWGPRPAEIQNKMLKFKKDFPEVNKATFLGELQKWYTKDKGFSIQEEFINLFQKWK